MMKDRSPRDACSRCGKLRKQVGVLIPCKSGFVCDICVKDRNREVLQELADVPPDESAGADFSSSDSEFDLDDDILESEEADDFFSYNRFSMETLDKLLSKSDVHKIEDLSKEKIDPGAVTLLPKAVAEEFCLIPLYKKGANLVVAFSDPTDEEALDEVQYFTGLNVNVVAADAIEIEEAIERYYEP